jgi:lipoprotein-releasing system permease protein
VPHKAPSIIDTTPTRALPVQAVFDALERCIRRLHLPPERNLLVRMAAAVLRTGLAFVQMEFLALVVPFLLLTGRFSAFHLFGVWKTLRGRLISYISVIAIASAVVIAFVPNPVFEGFLTQLKDKVRGTSADLIVETQQNMRMDLFVDMAMGRVAFMGGPPPKADVFAEIAAAAPRVEGYAIFSTGDSIDKTAYASVVGIDPVQEYGVSRLRSYIVAAGSDPEHPFVLSAKNLGLLLQRRRAVTLLGKEVLGALSSEEAWRRRKAVAADLDRLACVTDAELPALVEEYLTEYSDWDREEVERLVRTNVAEDRRVVEAELFGRLGETRRRELGVEAFADMVRNISLDAADLEGPEAREIVLGFDGRPGILVGKALLEEHPKLDIGSEIELITGSIENSETRRSQGAKNIIGFIAGTYESGLYDFDVRTLFLALPQALAFFEGAGAVRSVGLKLRDHRRAETLCGELQRALDPSVKVMVVSTWKEKKGILIQAVNIQKRVLLVILFFAVFVAGFGILLSLRIMVTEKVMDIGILMGLGGSPLDIVVFYVLAGFFLGCIGSVAGVTIGAGLVHFSNEIVTFLSQVLGVSEFEMYIHDVQHLKEIPVSFDITSLVLIVAVTIGASYQFALYPALAASRFTPLDAVRRK